MKKVKEDVEELKTQIIEKSLEIFANKDYDAINMKDISDAIGISRGPLYYHFIITSKIKRNCTCKLSEHILFNH